MAKKDYTILTRKIKLAVEGDKEEKIRVYQYLRDAQYAQYQGLNLLMGELCSAYYQANRDLSSDEFKKRQRDIISNSNTTLDGINFGKGLDSKSVITRTVNQDFSTALKNGLAKGERTPTFYKRTYPILVRNRMLRFHHDFETNDELNAHLDDPGLKIYIEFVNKITFRCILGSPHRSHYLRKEIYNIFTGKYRISGSKISIDKDIILMLSLQIPKEEHKLTDNCMSVKLGQSVTGLCLCKNSSDCFYPVGNAEYFLKNKTAISKRRSEIQSALKYCSGGHGRKKKLASLTRMKKKESGFSKTYNHKISREIVNYAIKNKCSTIILENLSTDYVFDGTFNKDLEGELINADWNTLDFIRDPSDHNRYLHLKLKDHSDNYLISCKYDSDSKQMIFVCGEELFEYITKYKKYARYLIPEKTFCYEKWAYYQLQQDISYKADKAGISIIYKDCFLNDNKEADWLKAGAKILLFE